MIGFVGLLIGCHAGGHAPFINRNEDVQPTSKTAEVIDDGTFPDIILPSGAIIRCNQKYTLKPGTTLTATEHKVPIDSNSANSMTTYLYSLTGSLKSDNPLESAVSVNTIEKPISVTISNNISNSGVCYLGLRNNENDSWSYTLATDDSQANIKPLRLVTTPNVCSFNLFRLGVQFRLFVFSNEEMKNQICIDSVTLKQEQPVKTKDEKYISNLSVLVNIEGENLNSINTEDIITKIIYRSKNLKPAKFDFTKNPTDSSDGAVTGDYEHSFEITNLKLSNSLGNKAELTFELNLNGVSQIDFPTNFLVEFCSKGDNKDTLPFSYTQAFTFETEEQTDDPEPQPEPQLDTYTITLDPNGGTLENTTIDFTVETNDFNLPTPARTGYTFLGWTYEGQTTPTQTLTIAKGSTGNKTFTAHFKFTISFTITSDDGVIIDDVNNLYYTKPTFTVTISPNIALTAAEKENLMSVIQIKDSEDTDFGNATATWNNDGNIALSFGKDLTASTTYTMTLSFGNIENITTSCSPFTFKTFYFKGKGATDNRYQIENAEQLDYVRNYLSCHFQQENDIDIATYTWIPIGSNQDFKGSYNGQNKKIKNVKIRNFGEPLFAAGLFGTVSNAGTNSGKITNLTVEGFSIKASDDSEGAISDVNYIGVIAGKIGENCSIENCKITGSSSVKSVIWGDSVGGICGISKGNISNCTVDYSIIKGTSVGGICCLEDGSIVDSCKVTNSNLIVSSDGMSNIGGIAGSGSNGKIISCHVEGTEILSQDLDDYNYTNIGGIIGESGYNNEITECYITDSEVKGEGCKSYVGGIVGWSSDETSSISNCYVSNTTLIDNTNFKIGGITANNNGSLSSSYVLNCNITGGNGTDVNNKTFAGGIAGENDGILKSSYLLNSSIIGGTNCYVGGIVGENSSDSLSSSYVFEDDNHSITAGAGSNLGSLVGDTYVSVTDCFYNKTDLVLFGYSENNVTSPNCYSGVDNATTFSNKDWSNANSWSSDYKTVNSTNWPPDLTNNPRPLDP